MYLYFDNSGKLRGTCSDENANFIVDGKEYSTATKYNDYQDGHDYELKNGKIKDLGVIKERNPPPPSE